MSDVNVKNSDVQTEFRNLVSEMKDAMLKKGAEQDEHTEKINARLDEIEFGIKKIERSAPVKEEKGAHLPTFKNALEQWSKGNRSNMSVEVKEGYHPVLTKSDNLVRFNESSAGALLLPDEFSTDLWRDFKESSDVIGLVTNSFTDRPNKIRTLRVGTPGATWLAEEAAGSKAKPTFRSVTITPQKLAARYAFSVEMFEDSAWDLASELMLAFREDVTTSVASAIINGDGVGKPKGFLNDAKEGDYAGLTLTMNKLIDLTEELKGQYKANASWLFNRQTRAYVRKLTIGSNDYQYAWEPRNQVGVPPMLLGFPVYEAAPNDLPGVTTGSYTDGDKPIVFGDFRRAYELVTRSDMYVIDDPYTEGSAFVRNINVMSRIGGHPIDASEAIVAMKMNT